MAHPVNNSNDDNDRKMDAVEILPAGEDQVVPRDFGLTRPSFDGLDFTYGIAHYDATDREDMLQCKDYVTDIFQHLYHAEVRVYCKDHSQQWVYQCSLSYDGVSLLSLSSLLKTNSHPKPYMDCQDQINEKMRAILIDWLIEVHMNFRLVPETLFLCVNIIDRYCGMESVARSKFQLVGVTALFLACKYEEIYPPKVRKFVYITDNAYDPKEVLDMEQTILRVLNWKISLPTAYPFLDRFLGITNASEMTRHAATYYLECTLHEHELLQYRPSMVCASAVVLALNNPGIPFNENDCDRELPGLVRLMTLVLFIRCFHSPEPG